MSFRTAVHNTPSVAGHYQAGMQALRETDRGRIRISNTRRLRGSVNLDAAIQRHRPQEPVWDYGIGVNGDAIWVEVHPASSSHVRPILKKRKWLKAWLEREAPRLKDITTRYVWIASGSVALNRTSPQARDLRQGGVEFPVRALNLD